MADLVDEANDLAEQQISDIIEKHRHHQAKSALKTVSPFCEACGDDISPERRAAVPHATRCYECENNNEKKNRRLQPRSLR